MKKYILPYIALLFICHQGFSSDTTTTSKYYLTLELIGSSGFYNIPSVSNVYKRNITQPSGGLVIHFNLPKKFQLGLGLIYNRPSTFVFDTSGRFPPGSTFLAPLDLNKSFTYLDKLLYVRKDFSVLKDKLLIGCQIGIIKGSLIHGENETRAFYTVHLPSEDNSPAFQKRTMSLIIGSNVKYKISSRLGIRLHVLFRKYTAIDNYSVDLKKGAIKQPYFYHRSINYGIGLEYSFLHKKKKWKYYSNDECKILNRLTIDADTVNQLHYCW